MNIETLENQNNLTFVNNKTKTEVTFQDEETVLVTINMSLHKKYKIKNLKRDFIERLKSQELYSEMYEELLKDEENKINNDTMFYFMFHNFIEFMLHDVEDKEVINDAVNNMLFTESAEILATLSDRKTNMIEVERIPSNLSMSLCKCCISPEETSDKTDFSRDDACH